MVTVNDSRFNALVQRSAKELLLLSANPAKNDKIPSNILGRNLSVLFEWSHECFLLVHSLEATMSHLRCSIDELELDWFHCCSGSLVEERFSESDTSLLWATDTSLDHEVVVLYQTVMDETSNWVDRFVGDINFGSGVVTDFLAVDGVVSGSDAVDLLVDLGTVMVSLLTLSGKLLCVPSRSDSMVTSTLGDTNNIDHLSLGEYGVDSNIFLEVGSDPVDLLANGTSVDLDFDEMCLLLTEGKTLHLGVADGSDGSRVFLEHSQVTLDGLFTVFGLPSLGCLCEGLLFG